MRPIKFRGRAIETGRDVKIGEYVFGDLRIVGIRPHIYKEAHCYYEEELIEVEPDTVAQLVGYDKNGKEVYEGDTVIATDRHEWIALFDCSVLSDEGFTHLISLEVFTLKENNQ